MTKEQLLSIYTRFIDSIKGKDARTITDYYDAFYKKLDNDEQQTEIHNVLKFQITAKAARAIEKLNVKFKDIAYERREHWDKEKQTTVINLIDKLKYAYVQYNPMYEKDSDGNTHFKVLLGKFYNYLFNEVYSPSQRMYLLLTFSKQSFGTLDLFNTEIKTLQNSMQSQSASGNEQENASETAGNAPSEA